MRPLGNFFNPLGTQLNLSGTAAGFAAKKIQLAAMTLGRKLQMTVPNLIH